MKSLLTLATPLVLVLAWPTAATAQTYCDLNAATPTCSGTTAAGLNECRDLRRCDGRNLADRDNLGGPGYVGPMPRLRYDYAYCAGARSCSPYECDPLTGDLVRNPNCNATIVRDRQKEAESACTVQNNGVRRAAETCRDDIANSFISAGVPSLPAGAAGTQYTWTNPDPNGDPCARAETSGAKDMGIGTWKTNALSVPAYDPRHPPAVDPVLFFLDRLVNPELKFERSQAMSYLTGAVRHPWTEQFSTRRTYRQQVYTYGSLRAMGDAAMYTMADPPQALPSMVATFCGPNRASAFVQGYFNPTGGGATATPANLDVTSSGGNSTSVIKQLLADTINVTELLRGNKRTSDCTRMREKWGSCERLPDGTFAHSMGAIATNVWGLPTHLNIGSVANIFGGGASAKNNCDLVPAISQLGLTLLQQFPTTSDATLYGCTAPGQMDCVVPASAGNPARWTSMQHPREANCTGPQCFVKWCAGRPGAPASQIWTGRGTLQSHLTATNGEKCVDIQAQYNLLTTQCSFTSGPLSAYVTCIQPILDVIDALLNGYNDHIIGGNSSVKYNGYQVMSGVDNLGKVTRRPLVTGIFIQNGAPVLEPPPAGLRCTVIEIDPPSAPLDAGVDAGSTSDGGVDASSTPDGGVVVTPMPTPAM